MFLRFFVLSMLPKQSSRPFSRMLPTAVDSILSKEITKNIRIFSKENTHGKIIDLKMEYQSNKPLVVMLPWLLAKKNHVLKYANFYVKGGFDVLTVQITPWQLLWPTKGAQPVASDIVKFLDHNKLYSPLLIHGFSVGGYLWSEVLVQLAAEPNRYQHIQDRIVGQVWDSLADITEIPEGFPYAVFPNNQVLQSTLRQYIKYHLKAFEQVATCHYARGSKIFHQNIIKSPALLLVSKADPVGSVESNLKLKKNWENLGIMVYWKCWDKSPHVRHFHHHPKEYVTELTRFIGNIGMWEYYNDPEYHPLSPEVKAKL